MYHELSLIPSTPSHRDLRPHTLGPNNGSTEFDTSGSTNSDADQENAGEICEFARQLTQTTLSVPSGMQMFHPEPGSILDPNSPRFDAHEWVKKLVELLEHDENAPPKRFLGVGFRDLNVFGSSSGTQQQMTVTTRIVSMFTSIVRAIGGSDKKQRVHILHDFEGIIDEGQLLLVLGPPGSGCSTLLKTIAGQTAGLDVDPKSHINFTGIETDRVWSSLRGDVLYNAEVDTHLPHLTVGETMSFAAAARSSRYVPEGVTQKQSETIRRDVTMAIFGISKTINTKVGDDFVRGVSGGERKRVSIAEASLTGAKLQCWDNTTRGLDSANAINFCKSLRLQSDYLGITAAVAIYQAPQSAYDLFDKVVVLYEGRQIFFGEIQEAKRYFEDLGFECPPRQTTPDFLTSMTSPTERRIKPGFENIAPRTSEEFASRWQASSTRQDLLQKLQAYDQLHSSSERHGEYEKSRRAEQAKSNDKNSPYTISYIQQVRLTLWRAWRRLIAAPEFTIASLLFNLIMALILGSMFYNLKPDTSSFYYRGGLMFFALLFNAFSGQLEILTVYAERPVVEKQNRYAFYHQSAQAISSFVIELPYKTLNMFIFNILIYFMANLKREAGRFFFFCLTTYLTTLVMSSLYRTLASVTRTSHQAMVPSSLVSLGLMIYTGFTIPTDYMLGWSRWMNYINPLAYAFSALMANEFHGRQFPCASIVPQGPGYENLTASMQICSTVGSMPGSTTVDGERYINLNFGYRNSHKWRNVGILCGFLVFFFCLYLIAAEYAKPPKSKAEVLVFPANKIPAGINKRSASDDEAQNGGPRVDVAQNDASIEVSKISGRRPVFHWQDLCYDISIKGEQRRILDHVDGWVKPGTSTALMGVSGAGKTTLLDVLATRVTMGVVTGDTMIDGMPTDSSFQHRVGYAQQQDIHLSTMTVREALNFSALLRQPASVPDKEKLLYVDTVVDMLEMQEFIDAVIGVPGEGLNVEQRKRLTIGVELAARPELLLFLDEPTSGLDSQTSWSISTLIKRLTQRGQAVLCTIHQPSAMLFDQFDRLLLLAPGGKTVYFGDLGQNSKLLISYLERNGATTCPTEENPAEWMLDVIRPHNDERAKIDWHERWRSSPEYETVKEELRSLRERARDNSQTVNIVESDPSQHQEYVTSFLTQFRLMLSRTWRHFWRSPNYIWSKIILVSLASLYLGFSFSASNTLQGLQNQLYAIFMFLVIFGNINEQIMPMFIPQRALYEARERPSKIYRWTTLILANVVVEAVWNTFMAVIMYFCWYYPVGFVKNTTPDDQSLRGFLVFLFLWMYMLFTSTFSHFAITWIETAETAGVLASLMWMLCIAFCGVGVARVDLPQFWTFMYRVSPATYLVSGTMSTAISNAQVTCASREILKVEPPVNMTCNEYLGPYAAVAGGHILPTMDGNLCSYCPLSNTNQFLARFNIEYGHRWRNFGILWAYIVFNTVGALALYWLFRVPKSKGVRRG